MVDKQTTIKQMCSICKKITKYKLIKSIKFWIEFVCVECGCRYIRVIGSYENFYPTLNPKICIIDRR